MPMLCKCNAGWIGCSRKHEEEIHSAFHFSHSIFCQPTASCEIRMSWRKMEGGK